MSALAKHHHPWRWVVLGVLAGLLITLCGCRELAYYAQAVRGEHQILSHGTE